ncbi:TolC family protein [Herbaspirillum sp. SJZ107]|uniref:TolC family protein n=1 Tax=Herbaspirillum sp. SJZ107 TaxID=2572881 RepID=UPI001153FD7B|nr:TolC family protein [Herbaspirillum sp. SJZ107]TQK10776.1 cobalt-zinc-cadmium efflux system outer membrane protein [Herbaspirillum sp. SJZ107]
MDPRSMRPARMPAAFLFAFLVAGGVAAQPAPTVAVAAPLTLADAIRRALEQPAVRAAAHEVAASDAAAGQAGNYPNPALSWLREGQQAGTRSTTVQISQPIELGGKRQARIALARSEADLARGELALRRRAIRADVIAAWYTVLVAQDSHALARELAGLAQRSVDVAARRVATGKVSPIDETRARLGAVDAATELTRTRAELDVARARLGALVGAAPPSIALDGAADALPEPPPRPALQARVAGSGAVARARSRLAAQEAQAGVERAARIPDLTITLGSQREDAPELRTPGRRQAVFGISVPLPLFDRNEGRLAAALRRTDKARDELAAAERAAGADLDAAWTRYAAAREEATLLQRDAIPHAYSAWTLTLRGFEAGKFGFLDVLDAQRTWFQARVRRAGALLAAWRAYADIERLAGADAPSE